MPLLSSVLSDAASSPGARAARPEPADWLNYENAVGFPTTNQVRTFPDFLVISPGRAGTTWIAANLNRHPRILIPPEKEVLYFDWEWRRHSIKWYCSRFAREPKYLAGDVSPTYALLPSIAIRHIHATKPNLKIVMLLRDPLARAWSHLKHTCTNGEANFVGRAGSVKGIGTDDLVGNLVHDFTLSSGDYESILRRWTVQFSKEQFHIAFFEDAIAMPDKYFAGLFAFLGLRREPFPDVVRARVNQSEDFAPPPSLLGWMESLYSGERRQSLERYLKHAFDLTPPWPNSWTHVASGSRRLLPDTVAGRVIELEQGIFWDIEEPQRQPCVEGQRPRGRSARFVGDLLRMCNPAHFSSETKLRNHGISVEDLRLIHELDRLAELAATQSIADAVPQFLYTYKKYNVIRFGPLRVAIAQDLGPIDLHNILTNAKYQPPADKVIVAHDYLRLESAIDEYAAGGDRRK